MTPAQIDDADLDFLLDMEVLDSKIELEAELQRGKKSKKKVFIDEIL